MKYAFYAINKVFNGLFFSYFFPAIYTPPIMQPAPISAIIVRCSFSRIADPTKVNSGLR